MPGLPKSIIKKYGVTKKAWSVFRGMKTRRKSKTVTVQRTTNKRGMRTMARRRKARYFGKAKSTMSANDAIMFGIGYGVVRQPLNDGIKKLTGNFALNLSDEVVLGALHYFGAKGNWFGMRKLFVAGLVVEASRLGGNLSSGITGLFGTSTSGEVL